MIELLASSIPLEVVNEENLGGSSYKMNEMVMMFIGQAGIHLGNSIWELLCFEHEIQYSGVAERNAEGRDSAFMTSNQGTFFPRALMLDLEPTVIDEIRRGPYRQLFHNDFLVSGNEGAANNFARGYYGSGREMYMLANDKLQALIETCDTLQGIFIFRAYGGGTGSGFGAKILSSMADEYPKEKRIEFIAYPAPNLSPVIVEPYNCVFTIHKTIKTVTCSFLMDNEAAYNICDINLEVGYPTISSSNRIIAQVMSIFTSGMRYRGCTDASLSDIMTNLVPYPRIRFPLVALTPLVSIQKAYSEVSTIWQLLSGCFSPENQLVRCYPREGIFSSASIICRGEVAPSEITESITKIKEMKNHNFDKLRTCDFKVGYCKVRPQYAPMGDIGPTNKAILSLSSSSAIVTAWERINQQFDVMFSRRAYLHHYVNEGVDEEEFKIAQDDVLTLEAEYRQLRQF